MSIFQAIRCVTTALCAFIAAHSPAVGASAASEEIQFSDAATYRILGPQGTLIGWQTEHVSNEGSIWTFTCERRMRFTVDGHDPIATSIIVERKMGGNNEPISLKISSDINRQSQKIEIQFDGATATIRQTRMGKTREWTTAYPTGKRLSDLDSLMRPSIVEFAVFNLSTLTFEVMQNRSVATNTPGQSADIRSIDGLPVEIWLREYRPDMAIAASTRPLLGSPIRFELLADGEAAPELSGSGSINHQLIPASYTISGDAKAGKIRYNFGLLKELVPVVPQTGEQSTLVTPTGLRMDICEDCGPGLPTDAETLARYTLPTTWLQSGEPVFKQRGERAARKNISDADKVRSLGRIMRGRLSKVDLNGHASALDAWTRRAGDCTEDAVVLATLARAAGIPAVVASGVVYTRERYHGAANAFVPHSWVIAYVDGTWKSFDYTLDGGFDSTHIALTVGEGDARSIAAATQIAAMLEWESMAEIRRRPTP